MDETKLVSELAFSAEKGAQITTYKFDNMTIQNANILKKILVLKQYFTNSMSKFL